MDPSEKGSLTVYKYDMTAAKEAGVDLAALSVSTGEADDTVEQAMREYAVEGVEFSYLYCGKAETYSHRTDQGTEVELVYEMPSDLTGLLGMKPEDAFDMSGDARRLFHHGKHLYPYRRRNAGIRCYRRVTNKARKGQKEKALKPLSFKAFLWCAVQDSNL